MAEGLCRYCRGGLMVMHLLALPDSPIDCGVLSHPSPDPARYVRISKPSSWNMASDDMMFPPTKVEELKEIMGNREQEGVVFECNLYPGESEWRFEGGKWANQIRHGTWVCG
jgi:dienelactone hydrolase